MKNLMLFIFSVLPLLSFSQNGTLKGKIADASTGQPLVGATIEAVGMGGTTTDKDGAFSFACSGSLGLVISYVGFL